MHKFNLFQIIFLLFVFIATPSVAIQLRITNYELRTDPFVETWRAASPCFNQSQPDEQPQRQRLSPLEERKFDYFFYEGLKLKNAEKFDASFEMFKHCISIDSTSSAALFELSSFYINIDQPEKAVALLKKSIAYAPNNHEYRNTLATLLFNLGKFEEAAVEYEFLSKVHPDKPELYFYLAEAYSRMGETGKAISMYDELENVMGLFEAISMQKCQLYLKLKQEENALKEIKKLTDKFPMETRYLIMLGDLYLQQNDNKQALKHFKKALEIDPESPFYPVSMANYYEKTGQRDSAKLQIEAALVNSRLDINTKLSILAQYISQLHNSKQDIDGANALFQTLLDQHPDESQLKLVYSQYLIIQNKIDEARFQIQIVTESEPENMEAWIQLLRLSSQAGDLDEMLRICKKCEEIFPEEAEFYFYLGIAYYQRKEFQAAIDAYYKAIRFIPSENARQISMFYGQIGDAYFKMRETDKAFNAYEEALKHNDKNVPTLNNYAYYLSLLKKDLPKAERMSALTIKLDPDNATYLDTYAWIFFIQGNLMLAKFYMEQAISRDRSGSAELADHYGDILYQMGEKEKAVEQWEKARELGKKTATVERKIAEKTYYEATQEELINEIDEETITINSEPE